MTPDAREDRHTLRRGRDPHAGRSDRSEGYRGRSTPCRTRSRSARRAPGKFEVPNWDQASQKKVRDALLVLGATLPDSKRMFGTKGAGRSGAAPDRRGDGLGRQSRQGCDVSQRHAAEQRRHRAVYKLTVKDVPVDGFWSISVYNADGYFEKNRYNAYSVNNITAQKDAGRLGHGAVRRLRRQDSELPADHRRAGITSCGSIARSRKF